VEDFIRIVQGISPIRIDYDVSKDDIGVVAIG
jgi:hypothetical protein